ncbi:mycothiol transferase [Nesterenkonia flava]|uniref:DUF664 domain-containing protein n=1 Tax=Nesterenkonia flava TaxID=469799 RepID=A0ABU1FVH0_9MICC|nr:DUF664 domain-containing protein [Nesterenkonia flava]MDR5712470.1 DUF664 domain-containing protein [Nesterenkonia flava]
MTPPPAPEPPDSGVADTGAFRDDQVLVEFILHKFDQLTSIVQELDDAAANTELHVPGSNSPVQLLIHCCGAMRRWSSTVNLGVTVPRDRESEFHVRMPVHQALEIAEQTRALFLADTAVTSFDAAPVALPEDRADFWTGSCRGVLLHVLEEVSQHLGHAEITRDLLALGRDGEAKLTRRSREDSPRNQHGKEIL